MSASMTTFLVLLMITFVLGIVAMFLFAELIVEGLAEVARRIRRRRMQKILGIRGIKLPR